VGTTAHQQNVRANHNYNDQDFPVLSVNPNKLPYRINNEINPTGKRIDEMYMKINHLDENLNRLIDINNKHLNHIMRIQQVSIKHEHQLQLQQADISFQHEFISQFISPICSVILDIIPVLVKQNTINDKTLLGTSLTQTCEKLSLELPVWTNRFVQNENIKAKLINEFNVINQQIPDTVTNNNVQLHPSNQ